ncbi:MAG: cation-translocating P-type ATPase [Methylocystis sp.]|uniref:cation-translocating P-type ATPase n=1 Tax=Methylocystis sp. TaxID=1911079 RepID=UPI003921355F
MPDLNSQGLSSEEAARRLAEFGPNEQPKPPPPGILAITLRTLKEPMFFLLASAALLYLFVGDLGEGLFMVAGAGASIALVVMQELRTERALEALNRLAEPTAICRRDGVECRMPARDLVPGDLILVGEGERAPADALLIGGDALIVDESLLTGESAPVTKTLADERRQTETPDPGGEHTPFLFAGTMIARGSGLAEVVRTGAHTAMGRLGASLAAIESEPSPLQQRTGRLVATLGAFALLFCLLVFVAYWLVHGDWFEGAIAGITLAIGLLPEEFPMVLAIFLALGAYRLARRNVLVRRTSVTETLGSTSILCVDKTGTLTQNRMRVAFAIPGDERAVETLGEETRKLIRAALRASSLNPVDPMDRAVHAFAAEAGCAPDGEALRSFPIRPDLLAFIQCWRDESGESYAAKGAPEAIANLARLCVEDRARLVVQIGEFARRGLRVLAVATTAPLPQAPPPEAASFDFVGLLAFEDPLREDVPAAVAAARRAGIAVAMVTGDYPATAIAIARQAGLDCDAGAFTGAEIAATPSDLLAEKIRNLRVFARVTPTSKLALVEAFKADGQIVAMTGDGVNDGPALAAAHIGIAMGRRGSDVAREAAHIVLLDDSFASIVAGVALGRRIFANLRRALTYVTAIHIPIAGVALTPILMGLPPLLLPAHVVLMELIIDPTCALVFESQPNDPDAMFKPPRRRDEPLFGSRQLWLGFLQGFVVFLAVMSVYVIDNGFGAPGAQARGLAFATLVVSNLVLALSDALPRGVSLFSRDNLAFWLIAGAAASVLAASLYVPLISELLRFEPPTWPKLVLALMLAVIAGSWFEVWRRLLFPAPARLRENAIA